MKYFNREIEVFNMSALDLFASAMGAFMIVAVLLFPYYMNVSEAESRVQVAQRQLDQAQAANAMARADAKKARGERDKAEADAQAKRKAQDDAKAKRDKVAAGNARIKAAVNGCEARKSAIQVGNLDLVFTIDTTLSMDKDINFLATEITGIVRVLEKVVNELRIGVVAYRDVDMSDPSSYVSTASQLLAMTPSGLSQIIRYIEGLNVAGGRSCAEAVERGLETALNLPWRTDARRQIVVIGDARAHKENWPKSFSQADNFAAAPTPSRLATIYRAHPSGGCKVNPDDPRFFRELATRGNGEYVDRTGSFSESVLLSVLKKW